MATKKDKFAFSEHLKAALARVGGVMGGDPPQQPMTREQMIVEIVKSRAEQAGK